MTNLNDNEDDNDNGKESSASECDLLNELGMFPRGHFRRENKMTTTSLRKVHSFGTEHRSLGLQRSAGTIESKNPVVETRR